MKTAENMRETKIDLEEKRSFIFEERENLWCQTIMFFSVKTAKIAWSQRLEAVRYLLQSSSKSPFLL